VSCQKTRHNPIHKRKGTPWPLAPGPESWFHYFQVGAVSRQQEAAASSRQRQQQRAGSSTKQQAKLEQNLFTYLKAVRK